MNKKFFKNIVFLTLSLSCFLLSAEQKNSASSVNKADAINLETANQAEHKNPVSNVNKTVAAHPEAATQKEQKEQLTLHSPEVHTNQEQSSSSSKEIETVNKIQGKKELSSVQNEYLKTDNSYNQSFLELGLEYPINFGVHLRYLFGDSFYTRFGISFMPRLFLDSFTKLSPYFGYLNEEEADVISNTFENSIYLDFRLAWGPYLQKSVMGGGPYLELGLSGTFYGNGELKGSHLSKVKSLQDSAFEELKTYSVKTNAYNATVHAGYQIPFEKVKLNIELGLIKILHADVLSVKKVNAPELLSEEQKQKFTSFLKKKGWIFPTVSGWISFAF